MAKYSIVAGIKIAIDFVPETFGRLTTIGPVFWLPEGKANKIRAWQVCQCECGNVKAIRKKDMQGDKSHSCGCLRNEQLRARSTTHGETTGNKETAEYTAYTAMVSRCSSISNCRYLYYGGRGIRVCARWQGPEGYANFLADMGRKPSSRHSLDRIDVNGDYCPENCRWATAKQQANNKTNNHKVTAFGQEKTTQEWAEISGIHRGTIQMRLKRGWSPEDAVSGKIRKNQHA